MSVTLSVTDSQLASAAIQHLGENRRITNLAADDQSASALRARDAFWDVWYECLMLQPWSFAKRRATLAKFTETPPHTYDAWFVMPADCLVLREIVDAYSNEYWEVETYVDATTGAQTEVLAGNFSAPINVIYTFEQTNLQRASPLFRRGFTHALAARIAMSVKDMRDKLEDQERLAEYHLDRAALADAVQDNRESREVGPWLETRV